MARIAIDGIGIDYELLGESGAPVIVLTPGGRFPRDTPGLPEFGAQLAATGRRVLMWDRPNCGASDISFDADNESELHARTLAGLIRALDLAPVTLAAGSAGSRVSLIAASRYPELLSGVALWWITGGAIGLMGLGLFYCAESATAAARGGMAAVADAPGWADQIARNPRNRDIILAQDAEAFVDKMQHWASFYVPSTTSPVPGMTPDDFARLAMPVLLFRNGSSDMSHTRPTSDWVHELIPHSIMKDPPWSDQEWNERTALAQSEGRGLFENWPALVPELLAFTAR